MFVFLRCNCHSIWYMQPYLFYSPIRFLCSNNCLVAYINKNPDIPYDVCPDLKSENRDFHKHLFRLSLP